MVAAKVDRRSERGGLLERKLATTVSDSLSAREMTRTPDSNASEAIKRVVSVTVLDGKNVALRRAVRPSVYPRQRRGAAQPRSDGHAVPLDLFPTSLLSNLTVQRPSGPRCPARSPAACSRSTPAATPRSCRCHQSLLSGDSEATFQQRKSYQGGSLDFLGFDDGRRALPRSVPREGPVPRPPPIAAPGGEFRNVWQVGERHRFPNLSLSSTLGNTARSAAASWATWPP